MQPRLARALVKRLKPQEARGRTVAEQLKKRGWTLVHARAKATDQEPHGNMLDKLIPGRCLENASDYGTIVGAVHISAVVDKTVALKNPNLAPWIVKGHGWPMAAVVDDAIEFDEPVPAKGQLGIWGIKNRVTERAYSRIMAQLIAHGFDVGDAGEDIFVSDLYSCVLRASAGQ